MKPGVSRLSMQSPGNSKSRLKSFKRSLLSFVRSPSKRQEKKQRTSFPTPTTARSAWDCPSPTETPMSTSSRQGRAVRPSSGLPPPPFAEPSERSTADISSRTTTSEMPQQQLRGQSKRRVLKDGKLLYEWEQNTTHVTMRLPASWTFTASKNNTSMQHETKDIKVLIAPSFLQVGIIHKKRGQKARIEWKLHHTTGGTVQVDGSTWTTPEEHQIPDQGTIITLCKAKAGINWAYALMHNPREGAQTKLCRPPRTKQRRPKKVQPTQGSRPSFTESEISHSSFTETSESLASPVTKKKKIKKKKTKKVSPVMVQKPEEESTYFQEKQQSGRRSGGEYSFKKAPQHQEKERASSSTHSTKPLFSDDASLSQHPTSPRRSGEYSMKPSSHSRLNIYGQEAGRRSSQEPSLFEVPVSPRRSAEYSMKPSVSSKFNLYEQTTEKRESDSMLDSIHEQELSRTRSTKPLSESSLFAASEHTATLSPRTPSQRKQFVSSRLNRHLDQEPERRPSAGLNDDSKRSLSSGFSLKRESSTFSGFESPTTRKRFSKPTSRISMEIKTPQQQKAGSSRSSLLLDRSLSKSPGQDNDKPKSRISMQLKKRMSGPSPTTPILVQSKASKMEKRESSKRNKNKNRNSESLDFVGHASEVEQAFPHKPYPNGRPSSKRSSLTAFLEKPSTHSHNTSGTNFKSVATANTGTMAVVMQNTLQSWTAKAQDESFSSLPNNSKKRKEEEEEEDNNEWNDDDFLQELEMSYSRMSTVM